MSNNRKGKVYIVGAGCGDPELLTVKAKRILEEETEVLIYDRLVSKEIVALVPDGTKMVFAGKEPHKHHMTQDEINASLILHAEKGKKVVRLKGGDPFIFGRGGEEILDLSMHGIDFEVIPAISASIGAAAESLVPLTYRQIADGVIFVSGHSYIEGKPPALDYKSLAIGKNTIVIYMGVAHIREISEELIKAGMNVETPCFAVQNATMETAKNIYSTLDDFANDIEDNNIKNPAIIIIGEVVNKSREIRNLT